MHKVNLIVSSKAMFYGKGRVFENDRFSESGRGSGKSHVHLET
jgi:hypothetical protein